MLEQIVQYFVIEPVLYQYANLNPFNMKKKQKNDDSGLFNIHHICAVNFVTH